MPNSLICGCGYELFWHMNPHRLDAFFEAQRIRSKEQAELTDATAWLSGVYVRDAIASCFSKKVTYPQEPRGKEQEEEETEHPGKPMTDADKFRLFAVKSNTAAKRQRKLRE